MRLLRLASFALASTPLFLAVACSDTVVADDMVDPNYDAGSADATTSDGSIADAGPDAGGTLVYGDDTTVQITVKGGFTASAPDGSTCQPADDTFTYVIATKSFSWKSCESDDAGIASYVTGTRVLSSAEASTLQAALDAVRIHPAVDGCGADKSVEMLELTSPTALAPSDYYGQFYHCIDDGKTYVDGLDEVVSAATALAH